MRYDLQLAFKRMDKVKAEKGYQGPVVVCAVYFTPIAGYIPTAPRSSIWSTCATWKSGWRRSPARGCWCRFGVTIPTPLGPGVLRGDPVRRRRAAVARRRRGRKTQ